MAGQKRLGELLVEMGFIDPRILQTSLEEQKRSHRRLGKILVEMGAITEERLVRALSLQLGIEVCDPIAMPVHTRVRSLLTAELAHRCRVIPIAIRREEGGQSLFVATADPLDRGVLDVLRAHVGGTTRIRWMLAGETEIELALARHYGTEPPRAGSHYPPAGQPVFEAPMTSALPPRHMPPVIQGVPIAAGRISGAPAPVEEEDVEMELVPLSDMLPSLDVRGRPPSVVSPPPFSNPRATEPPQIVRGARTESSAPPVTRDMPVPPELQLEKHLEELNGRGARSGPARVAAENVHVLTPDGEVDDGLEPIDSGEPINGSMPDPDGVVIEEPATLDSDTMPPVAIRLREVAPLNIEDSPPLPPQQRSFLNDRTGTPPMSMLPMSSKPMSAATGPVAAGPAAPMFAASSGMIGSWGDLFHGGEPEQPPPMPFVAQSAFADSGFQDSGFKDSGFGPPPKNGTPTFDIDVDEKATPFVGTAPISPLELELEPIELSDSGELEPMELMETAEAAQLTQPSMQRSPSQVTLEPDIVAVEDIGFAPANADTELIGASAPDDLKWNMALAEAAAEAMAEAELSYDSAATLEPSEDVALDHTEDVVLHEAAPNAAPFAALIAAASPVESDAQKFRKLMASFVAGDRIDDETARDLMRVLAALLINEGVLEDDQRLQRALTSTGFYTSKG